jgi:hypothetical protein
MPAGATTAESSVAAHMTAAPPTASAPEPAPEPAQVAAAAAAASGATKRARSPKRPHAPAGGGTAAGLSPAADMTAAPPAIEPAALALATSAPAPQLPEVRTEIPPPVCPYLGFKDDPATMCSYPDDRNVCHAAAANRQSSLPSPRRLVRGGRTAPISAEHQASLCLTAEHPQCERYPATQRTAGSNKRH